MLFILILCASAFHEVIGYGLDNPTINVKTSFTKRGENCLVIIDLKGRGVNDGFEDLCSDQSAQAIIKEEYFIFGNPNRRSLCFYSEKPNTLVVISKNKCYFITYETINIMTKISNEPMDDDECIKVISFMVTKIEEAERHSNIQSPTRQASRPDSLRPSSPRRNSYSRSDSLPSSGKSVSSPASSAGYPSETGTNPIIRTDPVPGAALQDYFSLSISTTSSYSVSKVKIVVKGFGIYDSFMEDNAVNFKPRTMRSDHTLIIQDPNNDQLALYSDERSTLVVIRGGKCTKRKYEFSEDMTSTTISFVPITDKKCEDIKQEMKSTQIDQRDTPDVFPNFMDIIEARQREMLQRQQSMFSRHPDGPFGYL